MTTTTKTKVLSLGSYLCMWFIFWIVYHANETSSAVPLNGTMYLIVSFYASWWGRGGGWV